jgi:hypothetical protein
MGFRNAGVDRQSQSLEGNGLRVPQCHSVHGAADSADETFNHCMFAGACVDLCLASIPGKPHFTSGMAARTKTRPQSPSMRSFTSSITSRSPMLWVGSERENPVATGSAGPPRHEAGSFFRAKSRRVRVTMTGEEIADELVNLWSRWSVNYDADKMIDELGELFRRLGLDPQGADRTWSGRPLRWPPRRLSQWASTP